MVSKFLLALVVGFGATSLILYTMNKNLAEKNSSLEQALKTQNALLKETQAELAKREDAIRQRDEQLAQLQTRTDKAEDKYAKLVRASKIVRDWDVVLLPDDVLGVLKAGGANSTAGASGDTDNGGGNP